MWDQWVRDMIQSRLDRATVKTQITKERSKASGDSGQPEQGGEQAAWERKGKGQIEGVEQARAGGNGACT